MHALSVLMRNDNATSLIDAHLNDLRNAAAIHTKKSRICLDFYVTKIKTYE